MPTGELYTPGLPQTLGNGLVLRTVADERDVERVLAFVREVHGADGELWARWTLSGSHPTVRWGDYLLVEDTSTGDVASSLVLIPQTWAYEGIPLRVGQVELVGTRPAWRHRGLIRAQLAAVDRMLRARECDLSAIAGIPYFYRQFGYEYALALDGGWRLTPAQIPPLPDGETEPVVIRQADPETDVPALAGLYEEMARGLCVVALRGERSWRFQMRAPAQLLATHVLAAPDGQVGGYFRFEPMLGVRSLFIGEAAFAPAYRRRSVLLAVLRYAAGRLADYGCEKVGLPLWDGHPLAETAAYLGAERVPQYAWQIRIADEAAFLRRIAPALERRLASSALAGFAGVLDLNLMRRLLRLHFAAGRLVEVEDAGYQQEAWMARFPPGVVNMLLLGYRGREEICDWYADAMVRREAWQLVDILFPKTPSHVRGL